MNPSWGRLIDVDGNGHILELYNSEGKGLLSKRFWGYKPKDYSEIGIWLKEKGWDNINIRCDVQKLTPMPAYDDNQETENPVDVPYFQQYDNKYEPASTCGLTSVAIACLGLKTPDQLYTLYGKPEGQTPEGVVRIARSLGFDKSIFTRKGTRAQINELIDEGYRIVVNTWLTSAGHVVCIVDRDEQGWRVNDPAGDWPNYGKGINGERTLFAYNGSAHKRFSADGDIWFAAIKSSNEVKKDPKKPEEVLKGKKIFLDPGHSESHPGARGKNKAVQEEELCRLQASILANKLRQAGAEVRVEDPLADSIYSIGKSARGSDMMISLHLNAFNQKAQYSTVMVHRTKRSKSDMNFAKLCADKLNAKLEFGLSKLGGGIPDGVYPAGLGVLSGAKDAGVPVAVLTESFFVDTQEDVATAEKLIQDSAEAIYDAIVEWYS